jgi:hypothetical protein
MIDFNIQGMVNDCVRIIQRNETQIGNNSDAIVKPFAQRDAVHSFVEGVDPNYHKFISGLFERTLNRDYLARLEELLKKIEPEIAESILEDVRIDVEMLLNEFHSELSKYRKNYLIEPMLAAISVLSKDELAEIAESMINLTSMRRRISLDTETVGGPIDVAIISKGDGFVWIRRKHYFDPQYNHHFFRNYFDGNENTMRITEESRK